MRERIVKKGPTQRRQGAVSTSFIMVGSETQLSIALVCIALHTSADGFMARVILGGGPQQHGHQSEACACHKAPLKSTTWAGREELQADAK